MTAEPPRRLPLVATVLVALAVATMIGLGIWQLERRAWKENLLARYSAAEALSSEVPFPRTPADVETALYRRSALTCDRVLETRAIAGRSAMDESGWAHVARCAIDGGGEAEVAFGWSREPTLPDWRGGTVTGWVAPAGSNAKGAARLIASPPQMGLAQLARPDPSDVPNNHLSYAVQWFFFAATALVIYALALRRRWSADS